MPSIATLKLIGGILGAAVLVALLAFAFFTVKGWRDDAAKLPGVIAQRDAAQASYAALDKQMTGTLTDIGKRIAEIQQHYQGADAQLTGALASIDAFVANFKKDIDHAFPVPDGCFEPQPLRDRLLHLFDHPVAAQPGADGGAGGGGQAAGQARAASPHVAVPVGRQGRDDQRRVVVPAAARRVAVDADRAVAGPGHDAGRSVAAGSEPALRVAGLGLWPAARASVAGVARRVTAGLRLIGAALFETAWDDKGDA